MTIIMGYLTAPQLDAEGGFLPLKRFIQKEFQCVIMKSFS